MASKSADVRPKITLACEVCKERNYITKKNRNPLKARWCDGLSPGLARLGWHSSREASMASLFAFPVARAAPSFR